MSDEDKDGIVPIVVNCCTKRGNGEVCCGSRVRCILLELVSLEIIIIESYLERKEEEEEEAGGVFFTCEPVFQG